MGKRTDYAAYDRFFIRSPLLPVQLTESIPNETHGLHAWLKELWQDPLVREGLCLASPYFFEQVDAAFSNSSGEGADPGILHSLLRYLCRFSTRCTPFGIFAGFATGNLGTETRIALDRKSAHHLHARPDMEYLMRIARRLEKDPAVSERLLYRPNSTLYRVGSRWHYIEVNMDEGKPGKKYDIVTIDDSGVIAGLLVFCADGRRAAAIMDHLATGGWQEEEIHDYFDSLVAAQVLVSELQPIVCGPEYLTYLSDFAASRLGDLPVRNSLNPLKVFFDRIVKPADFLNSSHELEPVLANLPDCTNRNHLVQVDMMLNFSSLIVDQRVSSQVLLGLRLLKSLSSPGRYDPLKEFRDSFFTRYGDRTVQLVKVLDPETGIGHDGTAAGYWSDPVPWIDDLPWGPPQPVKSSETNGGNPWLSSRWHETYGRDSHYLELESADFNSMAIHEGRWPFQMTAIVELFDDPCSGEPSIHLVHGAWGSPAFLLGRFGFADPASAGSWIRQLVDDETSADQDVIFAEVVHLPEDRTGNVLQRPSFLEYEIPYLAGSVKGPEYRIPLTDLMVGVEGRRVVLSSAASGKRIVPRMTNAYNHQLGHLSLYKLLHLIGIQEEELSFHPDWGDAAGLAPFIPGIRFNRLILSAPQWTLRCSDLSVILDGGQTADTARIETYRKGWKMPDDMVWVAADQELFFRWSNINLVLALWDSVKHLKRIRVRPYYMSAGTPVTGTDGSHANQLIFCYKRT